MRIGTALALIAVGAILRYAITWSPDFIDLQVVGVVLFIVGVLGLAVLIALDVMPRQRGR